MTDQLENLRQYNIWRRGDSDEMPHPKDIGVTLDWAIAEIEAYRRRADKVLCQEEEIERLRAAIIQTLNENGHLADGENCTLIALKRGMPDWELPE